ncbi:ATPase domain-containing protein [Chloroflexota bacterium]
MTTTFESATTGMRDIANALGGGIRRNSLVVIEGESKTGKSVLIQHLTHGALNSGENEIAYYSIDNSVEELIAQMNSMNLHIIKDFVADRMQIYAVGSKNLFVDYQRSLDMLVEHISKLPEEKNLVVVDSVTPFMTRASQREKMEFFRSCKELCENNRTIVLVASSHIFENKTLSRVYAMSDYYMELKSQDVMLGTGQVDPRLIKILEVTKLCGAERHGSEGIKFEIKPKIGIQILPYLSVRV